MIIKWKTPFIFAKACWKSLKAFFSNEDVIVSVEVTDKRTSRCYTCEHFDDGQCKLCTCYVHVKALFKQENCPIGRWPKV